MAKKSKWASEAALEALVKYGPQLDVLKEAQSTANDNYESSVAAANAGKVGIDQAVGAALQPTQAIYDQAGLNQLQTASLLGSDLSKLGPVADSIKAGSALEAKNMADQLSAAQANAVGDLENRRVQAASGAVAAKRTAQSQLVQDMTKILQQASDLQGQKGSFEASTIDSLAQHDADHEFTAGQNALSRQNSAAIAAGNNATSTANTAARLAAASGKTRWATAQQHAALQDTVSRALTYAKDAADHGDPRSEIANELVQGVPAQTLTKNPKTGQKLKAPVPVPGVPRIPQLAASVALDLAYDGHVSAKNVKALHRRKFQLKQLGYPTRPAAAPVRGLAAPPSPFGTIGQQSPVG